MTGHVLSRQPPTAGFSSRRGHHGFILLEAIVALVIFSLVAVTLYAWQNTNLIALERAQSHALRNQAIRSGMAAVDNVNPMLEPHGKRPLGPWTIRWTSHAVQPPRPGVTSIGKPSLFEVGLYEMNVQVSAKDKVIAAFTMRQAGYKQIHHLDTSS